MALCLHHDHTALILILSGRSILGLSIQGWNGEKAPPGLLMHITLLENSVVRQNFAAGFQLAAGGCILQPRNFCLGCLVDTTKEYGFVVICSHGDQGETGMKKCLKLSDQ
jgi:hypothetical protein